MGTKGSLIAAGALLLLAGEPGAMAGGGWQVRLRNAGLVGPPLVFDSMANVFASVQIRGPDRQSRRAVVKLSGKTGSEQWRRVLRGPGRVHDDDISSMAVTPTGDVVVGASILHQGRPIFFVARIAGSNGHVVWRRSLSGGGGYRGSPEGVHAVAIDGTGDVVAVGVLRDPHGVSAAAVVKFVGSTGQERWRWVMAGSAGGGAALRILDVTGDVLVFAAFNDSPPSDGPGSVLVLDRVDGHLKSRRNLHAAFIAQQDLLRDPAGDLLFAGSVAARPGMPPGTDFGVMKFSGTTGNLLWSAQIDGTDDSWETAYGVARLANGDVAVVGFTGAFSTSGPTPAMPFFTIAAYDDTTGAERWRRLAQGTLGYGVGRTIAVGPTGTLFVGGRLRNEASCYDVAVMAMNPMTGEVVATRLVDGTAQANACDRIDCGAGEPGPCPPSRDGIDQDDMTCMAIAPSGHLVVGGLRSDGPRGRQRAFMAMLPMSE